MIFCKELNKEYSDTEQLFKALREYKNDIISLKKAQIYKSCEKDISITAKPLDYLKLSTQTKGITIEDDYYYIAVNSTYILDSHKDLHINGVWNKTVKEQQGKNYLVADHELKLESTIVRKEHVEIFTAIIPFSIIGKSYEGDTEVLIYKVKKDKVINKTAKEWLDSGDGIEASVRMQYTDMLFAVKSDAEEDKKDRETYDKYIKLIANKEDFDTEILYFWVVKQAKNIHESSLVILGSNSATGQITIDSNKQKPSEDTSKDNEQQPQGSTAKGIDYNYLLKNLKLIK
jgi:hypothetical protein